MSNNKRVLYIVGVCLFNNTSANMSHNAFVQGFIDNGYDVDIIMPDNSWGARDVKLKKLNANYYEYQFYSFADRIRMKFSYANPQRDSNTSFQSTEIIERNNNTIKGSIRKLAKKCFYSLFKTDPRYGREVTWLKKAQKFSSDLEYDIVVSNSCPEASHKLVLLLTQKKRIKYKRWIQIWEDPWFYDLYGGHTETEKEEEHYLLSQAKEIVYVSPLTLMYQKKYYPDCADKMRCVPLPSFDYAGEEPAQSRELNSFGYFGDYYSITRNLKPFYSALVKSGYKGYIYGDSDLTLQETEKIKISARVTLDVLSEVQNKTGVLVHLSNLKGGQIPGKIYHYSATTKPILFILDGSEEEISILRDFFGKYDRYIFCANTVNSILNAMKLIVHENLTFDPIDAFLPKNVVNQIINCKRN